MSVQPSSAEEELPETVLKAWKRRFLMGLRSNTLLIFSPFLFARVSNQMRISFFHFLNVRAISPGHVHINNMAYSVLTIFNILFQRPKFALMAYDAYDF